MDLSAAINGTHHEREHCIVAIVAIVNLDCGVIPIPRYNVRGIDAQLGKGPKYLFAISVSL